MDEWTLFFFSFFSLPRYAYLPDSPFPPFPLSPLLAFDIHISPPPPPPPPPPIHPPAATVLICSFAHLLPGCLEQFERSSISNPLPCPVRRCAPCRALYITLSFTFIFPFPSHSSSHPYSHSHALVARRLWPLAISFIILQATRPSVYVRLTLALVARCHSLALPCFCLVVD